MKLIKQSFEIITPINGEEILKQIELAARTCYKSEGRIEYSKLLPLSEKSEIVNHVSTQLVEINMSDINFQYSISARKLIPKLISRKHEAMLEFGGNITVKFITDRGVSHELVRHRIASFAQESTRYCNYGNEKHITFIIPSWLYLSEDTYIWWENDWVNDKLDKIVKHDNKHASDWFLHSLAGSETTYQTLISLGWSPQQARSVLPNSLKTEINISANIREWRHIFKLRCGAAAHPQMIDLMNPLKERFQSLIPILFDDL